MCCQDIHWSQQVYVVVILLVALKATANPSLDRATNMYECLLDFS